MTRLGVTFERYWIWADPTRMPHGARLADPTITAAARASSAQARHAHEQARAAGHVTSEEFDRGRRWLTYRGPSARRRVLVKVDAPFEKPTRYWHASVVYDSGLGPRL